MQTCSVDRILPRLGLLVLAITGCVRRPLAHWGAPSKIHQYTINYPSGRPKEAGRREFWYRKPDFIPGQLVSRRITVREFDTLGRLSSRSITQELVKQSDMNLPPLQYHCVRWSYDSTGRVVSRRSTGIR